MSGSAYSGIDVLMKAEEEAAAIVQSARQSRQIILQKMMFSYKNVDRQSAMTEAREKAKEEVEKYRADMEKEFEEKKTNVTYCIWFLIILVSWCRISKGSRRTQR